MREFPGWGDKIRRRAEHRLVAIVTQQGYAWKSTKEHGTSSSLRSLKSNESTLPSITQWSTRILFISFTEIYVSDVTISNINIDILNIDLYR